MKKISIYLKEETEKQLRKEAAGLDVSLSECAGQLIELGLKIKSMKNDEKRRKEEELMEKTPEYLLRLINICSEVFRCTYDNEKVSIPAENSEQVLESIRNRVTSYIDGYTGKEVV